MGSCVGKAASCARPAFADRIERGAGKHLVAEAAKFLAAVDRADKEAISQQVINTRKACSACHQLFRN